MPSSSSSERYDNLLDGLKKIYKAKVRPVEQAFNFEHFHSPSLTDTDIDAKPMVLLLGQYSVGKTTFIEHLLGRSYPGAHIGPEPTTDKFVAVCYGEDDRIIPGNVATVQKDLPFHGLGSFGGSLMSKFQVSCCAQCPSLQHVTIIDSPGVLSGDQQRLGRSYDYVKVCEWFAERADMILLIFDAHKLDISDELKRIIEVSLQGQFDKIKIVLNKADSVNNQQLMRVYGALMWSLGKVIQTPEVIRVYIGSFWPHKQKKTILSDQDTLLQSEETDLLNDLKALPKNAAVRRMNEIIRRARLVKVHAYIMNHLREQMPMMFGKAAKQEKLIRGLSAEFTAVQRQYRLAVGDFPEFERFQERLKQYDFDEIPRMSQRAMQSLEQALTKDLPSLMELFPQQSILGINRVANPFTGELAIHSTGSTDLHYDAIDHEAHRKIFLSMLPKSSTSTLVDGADARLLFADSALPESDLGRIWTLADHDHDGRLDFDDFSIALHLIKIRKRGMELPEELPPSIRPSSAVAIN